VDIVVERKDLRDTLIRVLGLLRKEGSASKTPLLTGPVPHGARSSRRIG
jgi:hypothetical protein